MAAADEARADARGKAGRAISRSECRATPEAIAVRGGKMTVTEIG